MILKFFITLFFTFFSNLKERIKPLLLGPLNFLLLLLFATFFGSCGWLSNKNNTGGSPGILPGPSNLSTDTMALKVGRPLRLFLQTLMLRQPDPNFSSDTLSGIKVPPESLNIMSTIPGVNNSPEVLLPFGSFFTPLSTYAQYPFDILAVFAIHLQNYLQIFWNQVKDKDFISHGQQYSYSQLGSRPIDWLIQNQSNTIIIAAKIKNPASAFAPDYINLIEIALGADSSFTLKLYYETFSNIAFWLVSNETTYNPILTPTLTFDWDQGIATVRGGALKIADWWVESFNYQITLQSQDITDEFKSLVLSSTCTANGVKIQSQFSKANDWSVKYGSDVTYSAAQPFPSISGTAISSIPAPRSLIQNMIVNF